MTYSVAYSINDAYTLLLMAHLISLFEHANEETIYDIYIVNYQLLPENREKIGNHIQRYSPKSACIFLDVPQDEYEKIPVFTYWPREASFRVLLPQLLPEKDIVLNLDVDTLVFGDLSHLFHLNLKGKALAGVNTGYLANPQQKIYRLARLAFSIEGGRVASQVVQHYRHVNAGVLVMNLDFWREHRWGARCIALQDTMALLADDVGVYYPEQDGISYLLSTTEEDLVLYLPVEYNAVWYHYEDMKIRGKLALNHLLYNGFVDLKLFDWLKPNKISIVHMLESPKPWSNYDSKYREMFKPYADSVGLLLPTRGNWCRGLGCVKKVIKNILPYGVVRFIQKIKENRG